MGLIIVAGIVFVNNLFIDLPTPGDQKAVLNWGP